MQFKMNFELLEPNEPLVNSLGYVILWDRYKKNRISGVCVYMYLYTHTNTHIPLISSTHFEALAGHRRGKREKQISERPSQLQRGTRGKRSFSQLELSLKKVTVIWQDSISGGHAGTLSKGITTYWIIVFLLLSRQLLSSSRIVQHVVMSGASPSGIG